MSIKIVHNAAPLGNTDVPHPAPLHREPRSERIPAGDKPQWEPLDIEKIKATLEELLKHTRFSYSVNEKIDMIVVRIIDSQSDKVIKEIPSRELQKVHENIQEALGLLFDQEI